MSKKGVIITDKEELQIIKCWRTKGSSFRACVAAVTDGIDASKYLEEVREHERQERKAQRKADGQVISFRGAQA